MTAIFVIAALLGSSQHASAGSVHLVATINGSGRAVMDAASPLQGTTTYFIHARLYSDGTASGREMYALSVEETLQHVRAVLAEKPVPANAD